MQDTPLMYAALSGELSCVQLLLAHGADPNLKNKQGKTALMKAASNNYPDIIAELLSHGADDEIQDKRGWNALAHAEIEDCHDAVKVLKARKEHPDKLRGSDTEDSDQGEDGEDQWETVSEDSA